MPNFANVIQAIRPSSLLTTSRILVYAIISSVLVTGVVTNAFLNHNNFYSAAVYLSRSSRSALILANFAILATVIAGRVMQKIFFGPLRPLEIERLYDRMWFFVTESLLAFTIFRDEFDVMFGIMFGLLLFIKCFHWLMADRVEWMDTVPYPGPSRLFHFRFLCLFSVLSLTDFIMLIWGAESILTYGISGIVLFTSEYAILMASAFNCLAKYSVLTYDQRRAGRQGGENAPVWENKSMHIFYIELVTDFLKLITYFTFFLLVLAFYGLPLNIIRDVYITGRSFYQRCRDLVRYRQATKNMDERYPNASEAEMQAMADKTCIICREEMALKGTGDADGSQSTPNPGETTASDQGPNMTPKTLPCGHIFHFHCLRSWLERQQSCPTCRRSVLESATPNNTTPAAANAQPAPPAPQPGQAPQVPNLGQVAARQPGAPVARTTSATAGGPSSVRQPNGNAYQWGNQLPGFHQQPLRPLPQLQGFNMGGNGPWQPWNPPKTDASPRPETSTANGASPEDKAQAVTAATNPETIPTSTGAAEPVLSGDALDPRRAAALAAMRRTSGYKPDINPSPRPTDLSNQTQNNIAASSSVAAATPSPTPTVTSTQESSPSNSISQAGAPAQRAASLARSRELNVPQLIPLFDPAVPPRRASRRTLSPNGHTSPSLPSTVSEEQLAKLDSVTREAIDERLKVLDSVQHALWKSAEELLKVRSVLPMGLDQHQPADAAEYHAFFKEPEAVASSSEKGKAKEPQPELIENGD